MTVINVNKLTQAIKKGIIRDSMTLSDEASYDLALRVLNFFGYSDRIIDNVLEQEDRNAFYMLEDADILTTQREETTLYDGREWRIHYWLFNKERVEELISQKAQKTSVRTTEEFDYNDLPDEMWQRGSDS